MFHGVFGFMVCGLGFWVWGLRFRASCCAAAGDNM